MTPTIVDTIVIAILALSTIFAWSRGFTRESLSIIGWIIAIIVAQRFAYLAVPLVDQIPRVNEIITSCELRAAIGFVIVFVIMMITIEILMPFFAGMVQNSFFSAFDSGLGALFGFARGVILVILLLFAYTTFVQQSSPIDFIEESRSYGWFGPSKDALQAEVSDVNQVPNWLMSQFDVITSHCPAPSATENS